MVDGLDIPRALIAVVGGVEGSIAISLSSSRSQILSSIPVPLGRPRLALMVVAVIVACFRAWELGALRMNALEMFVN
jgi:hypothetical protein